VTHGDTLTIGIPFLNARPFLADAVRSVFAQTHEDWELILMDDGSTDGSLDVVRQLDDKRVRLVSDGTNRGLCARLNQIAALAQGKYLARMDADDLMHPERIERQLAFLEANRAIDVVDSATITVDENLAPLGIRADRPLDCRPESVLRNGLLIHPTVMGRTEWFRNNPYDPVYERAEDRELWCRTCSSARFARLCEPLFFYRESLAGNLRNYLRTEITIRKILRGYGPPLIGARRTRVLTANSWLKSWCYRLATQLGMQGRLIRRRNRPLSFEELRAARQTLTVIRSTQVPGLCGAATREEALV
jgi:glycosyltransferase involved in cell wall biosynthesis